MPLKAVGTFKYDVRSKAGRVQETIPPSRAVAEHPDRGPADGVT